MSHDLPHPQIRAPLDWRGSRPGGARQGGVVIAAGLVIAGLIGAVVHALWMVYG